MNRQTAKIASERSVFANINFFILSQFNQMNKYIKISSFIVYMNVNIFFDVYFNVSPPVYFYCLTHT